MELNQIKIKFIQEHCMQKKMLFYRLLSSEGRESKVAKCQKASHCTAGTYSINPPT